MLDRNQATLDGVFGPIGSITESRTPGRTLPDRRSFRTASYFSFTKSKTKIAQTPIVKGN